MSLLLTPIELGRKNKSIVIIQENNFFFFFNKSENMYKAFSGKQSIKRTVLWEMAYMHWQIRMCFPDIFFFLFVCFGLSFQELHMFCVSAAGKL